MPKATFTIEGQIGDFTRIDNLYTSLKREGQKLLKEWTIKLDVEYQEKQGEGEVQE